MGFDGRVNHRSTFSFLSTVFMAVMILFSVEGRVGEMFGEDIPPGAYGFVEERFLPASSMLFRASFPNCLYVLPLSL